MIYCHICYTQDVDPDFICDKCDEHYCYDCSYTFSLHYQHEGSRCYECADQSRRTRLDNRDVKINYLLLNLMTLKEKVKKIKDYRSRVGLRMVSRVVSVGTRSVRCEYTREMVDEISSYHGIDTSKELEAILNTFK